MKKLIFSVLAASLAMGLVGCGGSSASSTAPAAASSAAGSSESTAASSAAASSESAAAASEADLAASEASSAAESSTEGGKTLVVYYSASGNTQRVAGDIAEAAGADLFEIVPSEVYTSDDLNWSNKDSRVSREHDDESLRDVPLVSTSVENWDEYDTVFIGYPIWWAIAAWPVDNFVKNNDFTGKTVIPFATSSSSGMGQSGELLAEMAGTGDWQDGQRFSSGVSGADVQAWVESLGL